MKIYLSRPDIRQKEIKSVIKVLKTPDLSLGPKLPEFEKKFADYLGSKYAVGVNSGTSGLHLCIRALDIGEGDEVITSPFSFIASANCILFERAKPVFVDINHRTLNIDPKRIESKITKKTKAILVVHIFGYPCQMSEILKIAKKNNLRVIEDACEAIGAEFQGRKVGTFGDCATFAFYPNKQMTTAEGGIIVTDNQKIAYLCKSMRNQGRRLNGSWLEHERLGFNYRLSDINCALGITQLERIRGILKKRKRIAQLYNQRLELIRTVKILCDDNTDFKRSWFVYVIQLDESFSCRDRNKIIERLEIKGIECGTYFPPIHLQPFYVKKFGYQKGDFPVAESVSDRTIALPFYNNLKQEEIDFVCRNLRNLLA